jgi:hypothetical protein
VREFEELEVELYLSSPSWTLRAYYRVNLYLYIQVGEQIEEYIFTLMNQSITTNTSLLLKRV